MSSEFPEGEIEENSSRQGTDSDLVPKASAPPIVRLSQLSMAERLKRARTTPSITERKALERLLDRDGWQALISNPRITIPEIASIARKRTISRPLLERIINNPTWCRNETVRRAVLANSKITQNLALKVLRHTPKRELRLVPKQTAYSAAVRNAAHLLLRSQG